MDIGLHLWWGICLHVVTVDLSALIWLLLNWCSLSIFPLNLNSIGLKLANSENIHVKISWFGLLEAMSLLFAWLLCVDWGHNCRNHRCLHSFCVKTAESPWKLVSPQNNGYQTLFHLPALSPLSLSLQLLSVLYMQWQWLDKLNNYMESVRGCGSDLL